MVPWDVYQALGLPSLNLVPWKKYEDQYSEEGIGVLAQLSEIESDTTIKGDEEDDMEMPSLDRSEYGY